MEATAESTEERTSQNQRRGDACSIHPRGSTKSGLSGRGLALHEGAQRLLQELQGALSALVGLGKHRGTGLNENVEPS